MNTRLSPLLVAILAAVLLLTACTQPAPPPTPAQPPAAPTKMAEPTTAQLAATTAAASQLTSAPAKNIDFPSKGKPITVIVPVTAGGVADNSVRILGPLIEKDLGTAIQIVNKPGASSQIGMTELATAKPDGYTLGVILLPTTTVSYMDTETKAIYSRKSFQPLGLFVLDVISVSVGVDTPYKSMKDLEDAARAAPGTIKAATTGLLGSNHLAAIAFEQATGTRFSYVHFPGGAEANAAILGGHVDVQFSAVGNTAPHFKSQRMRVLGVMDHEESPFLPGVKTLEAQGYKANASLSYGLVGPAGMPKEIVDLLSDSVKKAVSAQGYKDRIAEVSMVPKYLDPVAFDKWMADVEDWARPLVKAGRE
jgi:tripartite-type tricarboxylate transporter receptor subunit TctC